MNAGRTIAFALTLLAAVSACAASLPTSAGKWDANHVAWSFRDGAADCSSPGGFAVTGLEGLSARKLVSVSMRANGLFLSIRSPGFMMIVK